MDQTGGVGEDRLGPSARTRELEENFWARGSTRGQCPTHAEISIQGVSVEAFLKPSEAELIILDA